MGIAKAALDFLFGNFVVSLRALVYLAYIIYNRLLGKGLSLLTTSPDQ